MTELGRGLGDLRRGFRFLQRHRALWAWIVAPALLTLALLVGLVVAVAALADPLVAWLARHLPASLEPLGGWVLMAIVIVGLVLAALLLFVSLAGFVAGPFNELLSEAVEVRLTGRPGASFSLRDLPRGAVVGVAHGLRRLAVTVVSVAVLFGLGLFPVVGTIAAGVSAGWLAARAAAYDCYDAVLSRRAMSYRAKLAFLDQHRGRSVGLGAGVAAMMVVPGLNLIALGIGAIGATIAAHELAAARPGGQARD